MMLGVVLLLISTVSSGAGASITQCKSDDLLPAPATTRPGNLHGLTSPLGSTSSGSRAATFTPLPAAVQHVYKNGVPHTDRHGRLLMEFDPQKSFLPLVLYDPQVECNSSTYDYRPPRGRNALGQACLPAGYDASLYTGANYTGVLPYPALLMSKYMDGFAKHDLQVIREHPMMDGLGGTENGTKSGLNEVEQYKNHSNLLGWYLYEEPTGAQWNLKEPSSNQTKMARAFDAYKTQYHKIKAISDRPVFILDCSWTQPPATAWWRKWNSFGDVSSHDNYPFDYRSTSLARINGDGGGIPQSVSLAVQINNEKKPLWLCVQTFESGNWLMPSARELRTQVYTSIVHGATGVMYFAMDSLYTRAGGVVGMGPRTLLNESYWDAGDTQQKGGPWGHHHASPSLLEMAASTWEATAALNAELLQLMPVLFARTTSDNYAVSFRGSNTSATPIRTLRKHVEAPGHEWDGQDVLVAVNIDRARNTAKFDIADPSNSEYESVQALFENRGAIVVLNGSFTDDFEAMDTHVYLLNKYGSR